MPVGFIDPLRALMGGGMSLGQEDLVVLDEGIRALDIDIRCQAQGADDRGNRCLLVGRGLGVRRHGLGAR